MLAWLVGRCGWLPEQDDVFLVAVWVARRSFWKPIQWTEVVLEDLLDFIEPPERLL